MTVYLQVNDFGRQVEIQHRFDDFAKLHETLTNVPGITLPSLPPKQMFGGNDPKVVEERRPMLEKLMKELVLNEKALADESDVVASFLEISSVGATVLKFLCPSSREKNIAKLSDLIKADVPMSENYRLFNEAVIRVLLHVLQQSTDLKATLTVLDVLQFILSKAHAHPLAKTVDVQRLFVALGGIGIVWSFLVKSKDVREQCRRVLSSLITSNGDNIEIFEALLLTFLKEQNGLAILFDSCVDEVHDIIAKLLWFGLSESVQRTIASHTQGLALLGRLYSSSDSNARCLAGLTLSVLISSKMLDNIKAERAIEGVTSILSNLISSTSNLPSQPFLSSVCRGSSNGLSRIVDCIAQNESPMSDFCSYVLLNAELSVERIDAANITPVMESALLANQTSSVIGTNAARFLFRLYSQLLPGARADGRIADLLNRVKEGLSEYAKSSQRLVKSEHTHFDEFQRVTVNAQVGRIRTKQVDSIDFSQFESLVNLYNVNRAKLEGKSAASSAGIAALGKALTNDEAASWVNIESSLAREWNQSLLGMQQIYARVGELKQALERQEDDAKCAERDSANLQQIISKMREEIVTVDSKAELLRKESSRFSSAAGGAVDPELMLQRAAEAEKSAKEEIAKREALRQSQDSLESQLESVRAAVVKAELEASQTRKVIAETLANVEQGERAHAELESRFKAEFSKAVTGWTERLNVTEKHLGSVSEIVTHFNDINALIAEENEQKDLLASVIGDLVSKLQRLQMSLQAS